MPKHNYFGYDHGEDDLINAEEELNRSGIAPMLAIQVSVFLAIIGAALAICALIK